MVRRQEDYLSYSMLDQGELPLIPDQPRTFRLGRTASSLHRQPLCWYPASQQEMYLNKLSYRRETALQGASVLAKNGRTL